MLQIKIQELIIRSITDNCVDNISIQHPQLSILVFALGGPKLENSILEIQTYIGKREGNPLDSNQWASPPIFLSYKMDLLKDDPYEVARQVSQQLQKYLND